MLAVGHHHVTPLPSTMMLHMQAYDCLRAGDGFVRCMLTNEFFDSALVCAGHLFKFSWRLDVAEVMGFININDVHNAVVLIK